MPSELTNRPAVATQCLHLLRSGYRCSRPALDDGFCERHGPDAAWRFNAVLSRRVVAIILGLVVLWPILVDLWHALYR